MKLKISVLLLGATFLTMAAGYVSFVWLNSVQHELTATRSAIAAFGDLVSVQTPKRDMTAGEKVLADDFQTLQIPQKYLPADTLTQLPVLDEGQSYRPLRALTAKQLLLQGDVAQSTGDEVLIADLGPDTSVASLIIANFAALKSQLTRGAAVDLYHYVQNGTQSEMRLIGGQYQFHLASPSTAEAGPTSLLVSGSKTDIARALLAQQSGPIEIALAGSGAAQSSPAIIVTSQTLQGEGAQMAATPEVLRPLPPAGVEGLSLSAFTSEPTRKTCSTAMIRGGVRTVLEVPCQ